MRMRGKVRSHVDGVADTRQFTVQCMTSTTSLNDLGRDTAAVVEDTHENLGVCDCQRKTVV